MKKIRFIILIAFLLPTLTGCWGSNEVNDIAIGVALGIDKTEDDEYKVTVQVLNPSEVASSVTGGGSGYTTPVTSYTASGEIMFEAIRKLTQQAPRKIYLAHLRMIVIGEEVAKDDIYNTIDFLSRDHSMRTDFYLVVSKDSKAQEILEVLTSIEKIPASKLFDSLEASHDAWAATGKVKINEIMDDIVSEGTQPILTAVKIFGDPKAGASAENVQTIAPKARLAFDGMAAFRKNKLVGWLSEDESKGLNYVKGKVKNTIVVIDINNGPVGVEIFDTKAEIIPRFQGSDTPSFEVKISGEANVAEVNTTIDLMSKDVFSEIEEKVNNAIEDTIKKALNKSQNEYESDIFGFGDQIHKNNPKLWKEIKKNWTEMYPDIQVDVNVDVNIRRVGTITNPFKNELLEE
ncbi:Ger(x)C family spore germination protein [Lysinibacillus sp. SGAir0095]|uniref:Ger(x)C family spore germination protein n=1 Tax=Lysinibacillus sp. SGAir0095 TaxID=2070463 RepID=UPI0010CD65B0|nr:Ger(x)C family spore germination protein [Lysinibacillus sp. SGAir0095]QCR31058.1 Ger(x)C family spore germination protein [Lysinibacillus sp. SGAir0095]